MKKVRVAFFGSSVDNYEKDIEIIFQCLFDVFDELIVVNGGYQGTMSSVTNIARQIAKEKNKPVFIQGFLFNGYKNDPQHSPENDPNEATDSQISYDSIGDRAQSMIDFSQLVVILPGRTGTLHETLQNIETQRWGRNYSADDLSFNRMIIHEKWRSSFADLYKNGNMSEDVYKNISANLFDFKEENKEALLVRLRSIKELANPKLPGETTALPLEVPVTDRTTARLIHRDGLNGKVVNLIADIDHLLLGKYNTISKNKVVGLDIALRKSNNVGELFKLISVGSDKYFRGLNEFLQQYKSIVNKVVVNSEQPSWHQWYDIDSLTTQKIGDLIYRDYKDRQEFNGQEEAEIEDWINKITKHQLGRSLYAASIHIPGHYYISAFLLLDVYISGTIKIEIERKISQFLLEDTLIESTEDYIQKELKNSTKTAISEIINRNMAHHLTSHVSNRATLDKILERLGKGYEDLSGDRGCFYATVLDLLNRFNQYRDERSEYLTYITNFSSPATIYFFQDMIRPFVENTLLMDNIAANENINYVKEAGEEYPRSNKLKIKIRKKNASGEYEDFYGTYFKIRKGAESKEIRTELFTTEDLPYFRKRVTGNEKVFEYPYDKCEFNMPDIEICVPGTLGKHALFSMLENFIRNSAKHGSAVKEKGLDIFLLLTEKEDVLEVVLTDNCTFARIDDSGEFIITKDGVSIPKDFNKSIQTPILKKEDLGLIDMKVSACLLAGNDLNDDNCKASLGAIVHEGKLAYRFTIMKPKKAVFIGDFAKDKDHKNGFYYYETVNDFHKSNDSNSFQFAVVADSLYKESLNSLMVELPARVIQKSMVLLEKTSVDYLYETWLTKKRGPEKATVHVYLEQSEKTFPTNHFIKHFPPDKNVKVLSDESLAETKEITGNKNILFDRHGGLISKFKGSLVDTNNAWILIDKNNPDFDYITNYNVENGADMLAREMEEAGLLRVLIIDERVAEQSTRTMNNDTGLVKLKYNRNDFSKLSTKEGGEQNLTLFDVAWSANVFFATHLNGKPLKREIDPSIEHKLDIAFENGKVIARHNILSSQAKNENGIWKIGEKVIEQPISATIELKPDVVIIHRTKLKDLIHENPSFVQSLKEVNQDMSLVVTTGSGTTHGITGDFKILPFSTLADLVLTKRIKKLQLARQVLQITKNKV